MAILDLRSSIIDDHARKEINETIGNVRFITDHLLVVWCRGIGGTDGIPIGPGRGCKERRQARLVYLHGGRYLKTSARCIPQGLSVHPSRAGAFGRRAADDSDS